MRDAEKLHALQCQIERLQRRSRALGHEAHQRFSGSFLSAMEDGPATEDGPQPSAPAATAGGLLTDFLEQWRGSGWPELDGILPGGGFRRGALVEWFAQGEDSTTDPAAACGQKLVSREGTVFGQGTPLMALRVARELCRDGGTLVILDQPGWFYPPAAAAWGVDLQRLLWLRVTEAREAFWALDQVLRCPAVRAVWCCLGSWDAQLDGRWFRRFQLAAEQSGCVGLFIRSAAARRRPSWAELQLAVTGLPEKAGRAGERCFQVELLRCRGASRSAAHRSRSEWSGEKAVVTIGAEDWQVGEE